MSRKDNKGRVLFKGETQRKDGRYAYSYTDQLGKRHSIYDKDLVKLRLKEKEIHRRMVRLISIGVIPIFTMPN